MKSSVIGKIALMPLVLALALSACASTSSLAPSANIPPGKGAAPTIVLNNTAPGNIDLAFTLATIQPLPDARGNVVSRFEVLPAFYYQKVDIIKFTHGETLVCNGTPMPMASGQAYISYTLPKPGTVFTCVYNSPQGQASFSLPIPEPIKLISPVKGATITRSQQTPISMGLFPGCKAVTVTLGYDANAQGSIESSTTDAPQECTPQQTINTTSLPAGPGELGVAEYQNENAITNNSGFHSLTFLVTTEIDIPVTWK